MVKGTRYPPQVLSRAEVEALMRSCGRSRTGLRNCALLVLLHRGGLRLGEALDLRPAQVDWDAGDVRVLHGKGDEARTTSVGRAGLAVLREWHEAGRKLDLPAEAPLICTLAGGKLKHQYVVTMLG